MEILMIVLASIAATTLMTLFSYIWSDVRRKQFREPVLLSQIIASAQVLSNAKHERLTGWGIHYFIGLLFLIGYHIMLRSAYFDPTWFTALVFGIISGVIGIFGWRTIFRFAPKVPRIRFNEYFAQLFIAHIIFALTAIAIYKIYSA